MGKRRPYQLSPLYRRRRRAQDAPPAAAPPGPSGPYDGPDADKLEVWWSATQPLETLDANQYAVEVASGSPRIVEFEGREAFAKQAFEFYQDSAAGSFALNTSAGDTWTFYAMVHYPSSNTTVPRRPLQLSDSATGTTLIELQLNSVNHSAVAFFDSGSFEQSQVTAKADVATVLHGEIVIDPSAGYSVQSGLDDSQSGLLLTSASGGPAAPVDIMFIGK